MNETNKCLACYRSLGNNQSGYHAACCKKFFGNPHPPVLPYALNELGDLAKKIVRQSITVPGVQEKLSLHLQQAEDSPEKLTLAGLWGDYILKPPVKKYPEMPGIEDLTMHLASLFRIKTVPHCLIPLRSGELAYITKRIDRKKNQKIFHMEDMCQLTERVTEHKYRGSMEKIGKAIHRFSSNPLFDIITFFEITLFSFLTGNADMHLKNFSLYYQDTTLIQLSPAYDLLATRLLIPEKDDPEEFALTLNGKKTKYRRKDFDIFAKTIGMNEKQATNAFDRISSRIPEAISFIDLSLISDNKKKEFKYLIKERAGRLDF